MTAPTERPDNLAHIQIPMPAPGDDDARLVVKPEHAEHPVHSLDLLVLGDHRGEHGRTAFLIHGAYGHVESGHGKDLVSGQHLRQDIGLAVVERG